MEAAQTLAQGLDERSVSRCLHEDALAPESDPAPTRRRPTQAEIEPAALQLIERHGRAILSTARRYSATPEDAEDAYQRGLEILLTKAPSTRESDLIPWLKTVVKHEAFALRRSRQRAGSPTDDGLEDVGGHAPAPHDQAERYERLRMGAEALSRLKPQEIRALMLRAEGYSYKQICDETGWTYTKVNRCVTEGRRSFLDRVAGIESGSECERLRPLLSALADEETEARDTIELRRHLRSCLACRATLREYRAVPGRVAALVPPVALATGSGGGLTSRTFESATLWIHDRAALLAVKLHGAVELASSSKIAAVAASSAALATGGAAAVDHLHEREDPRRGNRIAKAEAPPSAVEGRPPYLPEARPVEPPSEPEPEPPSVASEPAPAPPIPEPQPVERAPRNPLPSTPRGGGSQAKGEPGAGEFAL